MSRLIGAATMIGSSVHASDGEIGRLADFYFDDEWWIVRYLVVDLGGPSTHEKVLLTPQVVDQVDERERFVRVSVTRQQVRDSDGVDTDKPISLQHQAKLHEHYGWEEYWGPDARLGRRQIEQWLVGDEQNLDGSKYDPHLNHTRNVKGYAVQARDGIEGRVSGVVLDISAWMIRSLTLSLGDGTTHSLPVGMVLGFDFDSSLVRADATRATIRSLPA